MDVKELVLNSQAGDADAFGELIMRYQNFCLGYATSKVRDFDVAQDVVQESFILAHRDIGRLDDPARFGGWLKTIVHRRCLRAIKTKRPIHALDASATPEQSNRVQAQQERQFLLDAIAELGDPMQSIVTLYYLQDESQADVAQLLGLSKTFVNNQLYAARQTLKGRLLDMAKDTFEEQKLDEKFANQIAEIISVRDSVAEAHAEDLAVFDAIGPKEAPLFVVQRRENGTFACMASDGAKPGPVGLHKDFWSAMRTMTEENVRDTVHALSTERENRVLETGIAVFDLFAPIADHGSVGLFGSSGVGRAVFAMELIHRQASFAGKLNAFFFVTSFDVLGTKDFIAAETLFSKDVYPNITTSWITHSRAGDPEYAKQADYLDARIYFSPMLAVTGVWPAVDPLRSSSAMLTRSIVGDRHFDLVANAKEVLKEGYEQICTADFFEKLALGDRDGARGTRQETIKDLLTRNDNTTVKRCLLIEQFLTQAFYVAEDYSGQPGKTMSLAESLDELEKILTGEFDGVEPESLRW